MATRPREYPPGSIHLITRRVHGRRFYLRPECEIGQAFEYLLGYLTKKYSVKIHGWVLEATHYHLLVTDALGDQLPLFTQEFDSLLARCLNCYWGRSGYFWELGRPNDVEMSINFCSIIRPSSIIRPRVASSDPG